MSQHTQSLLAPYFIKYLSPKVEPPKFHLQRSATSGITQGLCSTQVVLIRYLNIFIYEIVTPRVGNLLVYTCQFCYLVLTMMSFHFNSQLTCQVRQTSNMQRFPPKLPISRPQIQISWSKIHEICLKQLHFCY